MLLFSVCSSYFQKIFKIFKKGTGWYRALPNPITVANLGSQRLKAPRHHRSVGGNPQQEVYHPFRACHSSASSALSSAFSTLFSISPQWRSAISATLIQSQPTRQSRQDTTPTAILSPLITYTVPPCLFSSTLSIFSLLPSLSSPSVSPFLWLPLFYFPCSLFLPPPPIYFPLLALALPSPFLREESSPSTR